MKKIYSVFMIAAALTMLWGCSSSDDDDVNNNNQKDEIHGTKVAEAPVWQVDMSTPPGDIDGMPNWEEVDFFDFEKDMTTIVYVSPIFGTEISADDRIAALVDGEVREVREPAFPTKQERIRWNCSTIVRRPTRPISSRMHSV